MVREKGRILSDVLLIFICLLLIVVCVFPVFNVLARSLSDAKYLIRNEVLVIPKGINLEAYKWVMSDAKYTRALIWTAELTVVSTLVSMVMTILCAYPLTYKELAGRKFINLMAIMTMYFSAGTIPNYLLMKQLNLLDNPLVLIIPSCLSIYNMIIMRSFLQQIPSSLRESAEIDGANPLTVLVRIYLPLSTPAIATLSLFYAVSRWNGFSDALMYMVNASEYYPIQLLLYNTLNNISNVEIDILEGSSSPGLSESLQCAAVMFATIPILLVYPWLQRYFIAGVSLGAVKE